MKVSYFSGIYIYQNVNSSPLKQAFLDQRQVRLQISTFLGVYPNTKRQKIHYLSVQVTQYTCITQQISSHTTRITSFYHPNIHLVKEKKKHSTLLKTGIKISFNPLFTLLIPLACVTNSVSSRYKYRHPPIQVSKPSFTSPFFLCSIP